MNPDDQSLIHWLAESINALNNLVWGPPMLILLLGCGLYLTIGLRLLSIIRIPYAFRELLRGNHRGEEGDVSPFGALMTALASTIGTGNIAGVAVAIAIGGPGALFWMWMTALVGMATKFSEAVLAVTYREVDADGRHVGGPMYYIKNGLGKNWLWLGTTFAFFGILGAWGTGASIQANSVADAMEATYNVPPIATAVILAIATSAVILGGISRIANVATALVPGMALLYVVSGLIILALNAQEIPSAIELIFKSAFTYEAAEGGFFGSAFWLAMRFGIARGVFSNESGQGSSPIAHAAARNKDPVNQGIIAMLGTFIDTLIVCTITGLAILTTGAHEWIDPSTGHAFTGSPLTSAAFASALPFGDGIVTISLILFSFTTLLGWNYYGERCAEYLFGERIVLPFRLSWIVIIFLSAAILMFEPRQSSTTADGTQSEFELDFEAADKSDVAIVLIKNGETEDQEKLKEDQFEIKQGQVVLDVPPTNGTLVLVTNGKRSALSTLVNLFWLLADTFTGLMAAPNLVALALLSPVVFRAARTYFKREEET